MFGAILARGMGTTLHMQFYRGQSHYWRGQAGIGYAISRDDGKTWHEMADMVAPSPDHYNRFAAFDAFGEGALITMFLRRDDPKARPRLFQTIPKDGGANWSEPQAVEAPLAHRAARDDRRAATPCRQKPPSMIKAGALPERKTPASDGPS